MERFGKENRIVSKLFHLTRLKFQILNTDPSSTEQVLDETGIYSIRQVLEQKMRYLQALMSHSDAGFYW